MCAVGVHSYDLLLVHQDYFCAMHPEYQMPPGVGYIWICGKPSSVISLSLISILPLAMPNQVAL